MYIRIVGDPKKAAEKLETKAILHKEQVLSGPESVFKSVAENNPELFSIMQEKGADGPTRPQKNKMIRPDKVA